LLGKIGETDDQTLNWSASSMSLAKLSILALAGLMTLGVVTGLHAQDAPVVDPAIATMTPEEMVAARKAAMREDGGVLRGAGSLTGAEASAAADTLIKNFTNLPALFPEGSLVGDSKALPAIWENFDDFTAIFATAQQGALAMKAAAEAGDAAAYGAALQTIGGTCGMCHQKYRG
jgi:cytochrome c556